MYKELAKEQMDKVIENLHSTLSVLRTGRANPNMLNGVMVDYYGEPTPINQMGQLSVVEGRQIVVKLYDLQQLVNVEKAINAANLGVMAQNDGSVIRINVPALTGETREKLSKEVGRFEEDAKVGVRNVRRDINDSIKKDDEFTEDGMHRALDDIQKITDDYIKKVEMISAEKVEEIMTV